MTTQHTPTPTAPYRVNNNAIIVDASGLILPWAEVEQRLNAHDYLIAERDELVAALRDIIASTQKAGIGIVDLSRG